MDRLAYRLGDQVEKRAPRIGRSEIYRPSHVLEHGPAGGGRGHRRDDLLHQIHDVVVVGQGQVGLQRGELRVVGGVDALVPEDAAQLEHPFEAAHDQPFEVEFGSDTEIHVEVESVVVGHERAGESASGQALQHRRLDFEEAAGFELVAQLRQDAGPYRRHPTRIFVDDEIEVALTVPAFFVLQAVPFLGQRPQGLGKQLELCDPNAQFTPPGRHHFAPASDPIARINRLEALEAVGAEGLPIDEQLDGAPGVLQHRKDELPHPAQVEHPARYRYLPTGLPSGFELSEFGLQVPRPGGTFKTGRVRLFSPGLHCLELLETPSSQRMCMEGIRVGDPGMGLEVVVVHEWRP